jgi:hypothetical protein
VAAAYGHDKGAAICDRCPGLGRDERSSFSGDRAGIGKHFYFHLTFSPY